jgi:hypothetical protein
MHLDRRLGFSLLVLAGAASAQTTGQLVIASDPPGAQISVDGEPVGVATLSLKDQVPGEHVVEAKWPDGTVARTVGKVIAGSSIMVEVSSPALPPKVKPPPAATETASEAPPEPPSRRPWWLLLGSGMGALAVGYISSIVFAIDGLLAPLVLAPGHAGDRCNSGTDQAYALIPFAGPAIASGMFSARCDQKDDNALIGLWAGITTVLEVAGVAAIVAGVIIPRPLPKTAWLILPGVGMSPYGLTLSTHW